MENVLNRSSIKFFTSFVLIFQFTLSSWSLGLGGPLLPPDPEFKVWLINGVEGMKPRQFRSNADELKDRLAQFQSTAPASYKYHAINHSFYEEKASEGHLEVMVLLGSNHLFGRGTKRSSSEALRWFALAAEGGSVDGMLACALMYTEDQGITPNNSQVQHWLNQASSAGSQDAKHALIAVISEPKEESRYKIEPEYRKSQTNESTEQIQTSAQSQSFPETFVKTPPRVEVVESTQQSEAAITTETALSSEASDVESIFSKISNEVETKVVQFDPSSATLTESEAPPAPSFDAPPPPEYEIPGIPATDPDLPPGYQSIVQEQSSLTNSNPDTLDLVENPQDPQNQTVPATPDSMEDFSSYSQSSTLRNGNNEAWTDNSRIPGIDTETTEPSTKSPASEETPETELSVPELLQPTSEDLLDQAEALFDVPDRSESELELAVEKLYKAADLGNQEARYYLALKLLEGEDLEPDQEGAFGLLWELARDKHLGAITTLINLGVNRAIPMETLELKGLLRAAADLGHTDSQLMLAELNQVSLESGESTRAEVQEERAELIERAAQEDLGARVLKATELLRNGHAVEAYRVFEEAADKGSVQAMLSLAKLNQYGVFEIRDQKDSLYWYSRAAYKGDPEAQFQMAQMLKQQEHLLSESYRWFVLSAQKGHPQAAFHLAVMYSKGLGVPRNDHKAAFWYEQAANRNIIDAQALLGTMFWSGRGVEQDYENALYWFSRAALQGDEQIQRLLLEIYSGEKELTPDMTQAYAWASILATSDKSYEHYLTKFAAFLSPDEVREAQALSLNYWSKILKKKRSSQT